MAKSVPLGYLHLTTTKSNSKSLANLNSDQHIDYQMMDTFIIGSNKIHSLPVHNIPQQSQDSSGQIVKRVEKIEKDFGKMLRALKDLKDSQELLVKGMDRFLIEQSVRQSRQRSVDKFENVCVGVDFQSFVNNPTFFLKLEAVLPNFLCLVKFK